MNKFLFVGEKPSKKAIEIGATWETAQLSGKTLSDALSKLNITEKKFINLFGYDHTASEKINDFVLGQIEIIKHHMNDFKVVGMGNKVQKILEENNIEHIKIIHPAARGKIRKKNLYQEHVLSQLNILGTIL